VILYTVLVWLSGLFAAETLFYARLDQRGPAIAAASIMAGCMTVAIACEVRW
jgi:hypothetical protein